MTSHLFSVIWRKSCFSHHLAANCIIGRKISILAAVMEFSHIGFSDIINCGKFGFPDPKNIGKKILQAMFYLSIIWWNTCILEVIFDFSHIWFSEAINCGKWIPRPQKLQKGHISHVLSVIWWKIVIGRKKLTLAAIMDFSHIGFLGVINCGKFGFSDPKNLGKDILQLQAMFYL